MPIQIIVAMHNVLRGCSWRAPCWKRSNREPLTQSARHASYFSWLAACPSASTPTSELHLASHSSCAFSVTASTKCVCWQIDDRYAYRRTSKEGHAGVLGVQGLSKGKEAAKYNERKEQRRPKPPACAPLFVELVAKGGLCAQGRGGLEKLILASRLWWKGCDGSG